MAVYPCDWGRHRYPQAQQSVYATHLIGHVADTYKMRLCPSHFRTVLVGCQEMMSPLDEASTTATVCYRCQGDVAGALFMKLFPAKDEPRHYVADLCAQCLSDVGNNLRIFNGDHFTGPGNGPLP